MKQITVQISDRKYSHFVELLKSLDYVKKVDDTVASEKQKILQELRQAIKELTLIEQGKLKSRPLKNLLDEL